jgi:coatomer subunit beta
MLLQSSSHSVKFEAAGTLVALTSNVSAVKAAASCYIDLVIKESDNNVKLIVLERIAELQEKHERILNDLVMDILRVLTRYFCVPCCCCNSILTWAVLISMCDARP